MPPVPNDCLCPRTLEQVALTSLIPLPRAHHAEHARHPPSDGADEPRPGGGDDVISAVEDARSNWPSLSRDRGLGPRSRLCASWRTRPWLAAVALLSSS